MPDANGSPRAGAPSASPSDPASAAGMDAASDAANAGGATTPPTADMHAERGGVAEPVAGADAPPPRPEEEQVHVESAVQNDCCDDDGDHYYDYRLLQTTHIRSVCLHIHYIHMRVHACGVTPS